MEIYVYKDQDYARIFMPNSGAALCDIYTDEPNITLKEIDRQLRKLRLRRKNKWVKRCNGDTYAQLRFI